MRLMERVRRERPAEDDWHHVAVHIGRSVVEAATDGMPSGNRILDRVEATAAIDATVARYAAADAQRFAGAR